MEKLTKEQRKDKALEEYRKIIYPAWKEYRKIKDPAWKKYNKIEDSAFKEYLKKCKEIDKEGI